MLSVNSLAKAGVERPSILARLEQKSEKIHAYGQHLVAFVRKFGGATEEFISKFIISFAVRRNPDNEILRFGDMLISAFRFSAKIGYRIVSKRRNYIQTSLGYSLIDRGAATKCLP